LDSPLTLPAAETPLLETAAEATLRVAAALFVPFLSIVGPTLSLSLPAILFGNVVPERPVGYWSASPADGYNFLRPLF